MHREHLELKFEQLAREVTKDGERDPQVLMVRLRDEMQKLLPAEEGWYVGITVTRLIPSDEDDSRKFPEALSMEDVRAIFNDTPASHVHFNGLTIDLDAPIEDIPEADTNDE